MFSKPDIVHFHGTESNLIEAIDSIQEIPKVVSIQGIVSSIGYQVNSVASFFSLNSIEYFQYVKNLKRRFEVRKLREKKYLKDVIFIAGRTAYDRDISKLLAINSRYHHIDRILRKEFYEQSWETREIKKIKLYTTMSPSFLKGLDVIVQALILLKDNLDVEWTVAGVGNNDNVAKILRKKYKKQYPSNNLKLLGRLTSSEIIKEMSNSNIYVMTSHIENSPNSLSEALLFGIPCIASNVGGTSSLINDDIDGVMYQHSDPLSLASKINRVSLNYNEYIEMANKARERALARHNPDKVYSGLIDLYKTIKL